jgi:hypothetical protein
MYLIYFSILSSGSLVLAHIQIIGFGAGVDPLYCCVAPFFGIASYARGSCLPPQAYVAGAFRRLFAPKCIRAYSLKAEACYGSIVHENSILHKR